LKTDKALQLQAIIGKEAIFKNVVKYNNNYR